MKKIDSLNLVPFIDIMLVLLVIILTSASFVQTQKVRVSIPEVSKEESQSSENKNINIVISKDGEYFFNDKRIGLQDLVNKILTFPLNTEILLNGDKESSLDSFIQIFNMLQDAGFNNVFVLVNSTK